MVDVATIVGTWRMLSWKREFVETGDQIDSLGPDPLGFVTYTADGRVHAMMVQKDRAKPAASPPSDADKIRLFKSMLAYTGTYELFGDRIAHRPDTKSATSNLTAGGCTCGDSRRPTPIPASRSFIE